MLPQMNRRLAITWSCTVAALLLLALADLMAGPMDIGIREILGAIFFPSGGNAEAVVMQLRLPRTVTAIIAGAALAVSGTQMQAVFRNPLADPHIMGVSAGAGTGAAAVMLAGGMRGLAAGLGTAAGAALGALLISLIIIYVSSRVHSASALLITGVMLGFVMSAFTSVLEYQADETHLRMFWNWSAGSFTGNSWTELAIMAACLMGGLLMAFPCCKGMSILLFGDDYARAAGADVRKIRGISMLSCCVMTGAVTAFCGPVGFVGIVAPHIVRMFTGISEMRTVLPLSVLTGASMGLAGDILSQLFPAPVPVGSAVAILGIPLVFLIMVSSSRRDVRSA